MKSLWLFLVGLLLLPFLAQAQEEWVIKDFNSDIHIGTDGAVTVKETVVADFGNIVKHGVIRDLPYVYDKEGGGYVYTRVTDVEVMQDGEEAEVEITKDATYVHIRIGDPDITISGTHRYEIAYTVMGVLQAFEGFDELNWNVTGNTWDAPIALARAAIHVPAPIVQTACYQGALGISVACDQAETVSDVATFSADDLGAGEGLTVAVGFKSGIIPIIELPKPPSVASVMSSWSAWAVALGLVLVGALWLLRHGYMYGRDRYWQRAHLPGVRSDRDGHGVSEKILPLLHRSVVAAEYDPPDNLRPAEIGVLMDERVHTLDVSATIVDLASRGFLEITEISKSWVLGKSDYEFTRTAKQPDGLMKYEVMLLERLFDGETKVNMSDLRDSFYRDLEKVKKLLYEEVVAKKLFPINPNTVRLRYVGLGIALIVLGVGVFLGSVALLDIAQVVAFYHYGLGGLSAALVVVGVMTMLASMYMPRKTGYGRELYQRVLGYELFVSGTEKYRAKFLEKEGLFLEVLSYAIVFGVTDRLARAFQEMGIQPPSPTWYHGTTPFRAIAFASSMNTFSRSVGSAMASAPSRSGSGGGGFSGGGFGGGGGSSW